MALERRGDHWLWVGGPVPRGSAAITVWSVVSVRREAAETPGLIRHEQEHVRQWHELGPAGFLRQYLGSYLAARWRGYGHKAAYRLIPLEIEASEAERRFLASVAGTAGASVAGPAGIEQESSGETGGQPLT